MRFLFLICLAGWLLLAAPTEAHAGLVAAAVSAVAGAIKAGGLAGILLKGVITTALNAGFSLVKRALDRKKQRQQERGVNFSLDMGDDLPLTFPIGTYAVGGRRKYPGVWGDRGDFFVDVIEISSLPLPGQPGLWVNDQKCTIDWATPHPDGRGYPVTTFRQGGEDYLWISYLDGTQTTAHAYLTDKFGSDPNRPYSSDMIGRGCAIAVLTVRFNAELFSSAPTYLFEPPLLRLYDLRKDSTNGGSGAHRWDNPATWEGSDNPAVMIYNIIRGIRYGSEWVYGGQGVAAFQLPPSSWIAAANECDVLVPLASGGTEKQFRAGYEVAVDKRPDAVIRDLLEACNGRMAEVGGAFKILVGAPGAAVYAFTDDQVIITRGQSFRPFPTLDRTFNGISATYPEPAQKWTMKDAPARYSSVLEAADGGRRLAMSVDLVAAPFAVQVQRIIKTMIEEERRFRTHAFGLPPDAWALEPNDVVAWTSSRNGYVSKKFLVVSIDGEATLNQGVALKEIDPADYSWSSSDQMAYSIGWVGRVAPAATVIVGWGVAGVTLDDNAGVARRPSIQVTAPEGLGDVQGLWVQVKLAGAADDQLIFDRSGIVYAYPYRWTLDGVFLSNTDYLVRIREMPFSNRATAFSGWLPVRTPLIAESDITVELGNIGTSVSAVFRDLYAGLEEDLRPRLQELEQAFSLMGALGEVQRRQLRVEIGRSLAQIVEEARVRASGDEAMAQLYTALTATVGANLARLVTEETARATADSALASSITALSATVGTNLARLQTEEVARADGDSALSSSLTALSSQVGTVQADVVAEQSARSSADSALASSISGVSADLNGRFAQGLVKFEAAAAPAGVTARFAILLKADSGSGFVQSGLLLEIYNTGSGLASRLAINVDQFVLFGGSSVRQPFVFEDGEAKMVAARIGTIRSGRLLSLNGKMDINLDQGTIEVYS